VEEEVGKMAVPVTRLLMGLLASSFSTLAAADEGRGSRLVGSEFASNRVAIVDELRRDLAMSLRDQVIASMRVEMNQIVEVVRANGSRSDFEPEWEIAAQVEQDQPPIGRP
jgi:hypothetical protein